MATARTTAAPRRRDQRLPRRGRQGKEGHDGAYWVPGVNNLGTYGRWAFAEFTDVYQIEADFEAKVEAEFAADRIRYAAAGTDRRTSLWAEKHPHERGVETLKHDEATRTNIPTAEYQSVMDEEKAPSASPTSGATATSTRNWSGAARTSRTGPT